MKITNWDKWQTFRKDRGTPPWIKIYRNLLSNYEWVQLSDAEKGQLVSIWILAADKHGVIPDCAATIQRMCMLSSKPNIKKFKELGFLSTTCQPDGCHDDANLTHQSRVETEESREEERQSRKRFAPPSLEEIKAYIIEKNYTVNPDNFFNHYEANGWMVGKNKMKSWKAGLASWNSREKSKQQSGSKSGQDAIDRFLAEDKTLEGEFHVVK